MKKNVLRVISIILVTCLMAVLAVGCGTDDDKKQENNTANTNSTESNDKKPTATEDVTPKSQDSEPTSKPDKVKYTIADQVLVDNEVCTFKIVKAEEDDFWGFKVKVYCENKTADKNLMFSVDDVSVNGYLIDPYWANTVAPGKKNNGELTFNSDYFDEAGITAADEIRFKLKVYDSDDWEADYFVEDRFAIYPTGKSADAVQYPARKTTDTEKVIIDNDDISFVILEAGRDDFWGYRVLCYIENKTGKTLMYTWDDVSVNGFMIDPFWSKELGPDMRCYGKITFFDSAFEENNITTVEEIEYTLRIYDYDDWDADDLFEEKLTYKP